MDVLSGGFNYRYTDRVVQLAAVLPGGKRWESEFG